ncbi:MAG: NAD(P)/FAD-dependent oxidoreductase [Kordiimonadaceae bacterium]|nr:NAD(P)/FAD-dependent oxidoreductase [Kordiimonadaceae bacterium]
MQQYDTIIIGAGHNGLICAAYLAKAGQKVLVLEASDKLGGLAAKREFHPGFRTSVAQSVNQFSSKVMSDLNLAKHGYKPGDAIATVGLNEDGDNVSIKGDTVTGVSEKDASNYKKYRKMMLHYANVLKPYSLKTVPRIGFNSLSEIMLFAKMGLNLRMLGKKDLQEFMRMVTLPTRDLMDENFDNDILKAALSWDGLIGSKNAPRSPNHSILMMLYRMTGDHGGDHAIPSGGIESLVSVLVASAKANGAEIRTGSPVKQITIQGDEDGLKATGVELGSGEKITADRVVSSADPKTTFFKLVGVDNLEIQFTNRINRLSSEGYVAKLHLALSGVPEFKGVSKPDGRMIIATKMDDIEFAWDDAKYGDVSENPVIEMVVPSLYDSSMAPDGQHVLSANVMYIPANLNGGWTDDAKQKLTDRIIDEIAKFAPNIREQILHRELLTPADLESEYNVTGGHWHHTEFSLHEMMMMRPTYEAAQYKTPIPGLYLAGAGSHPGGGLMGGPGHNAAHEILK